MDAKLFDNYIKISMFPGRVEPELQIRSMVFPQPIRVTPDFDGAWEWLEPDKFFDDLTMAAEIKGLGPYRKGVRLWAAEWWRIGAWDEDSYRIAVDYSGRDWVKTWLDVEDDDIFEFLWSESSDEAQRAFGGRDDYEWEPGHSPCRWRAPETMPEFVCRSRYVVENVSIEYPRLIHGDYRGGNRFEDIGWQFVVDVKRV